MLALFTALKCEDRARLHSRNQEHDAPIQGVTFVTFGVKPRLPYEAAFRPTGSAAVRPGIITAATAACARRADRADIAEDVLKEAVLAAQRRGLAVLG